MALNPATADGERLSRLPERRVEPADRVRLDAGADDARDQRARGRAAARGTELACPDDYVRAVRRVRTICRTGPRAPSAAAAVDAGAERCAARCRGAIARGCASTHADSAAGHCAHRHVTVAANGGGSLCPYVVESRIDS